MVGIVIRRFAGNGELFPFSVNFNHKTRISMTVDTKKIAIVVTLLDDRHPISRISP